MIGYGSKVSKLVWSVIVVRLVSSFYYAFLRCFRTRIGALESKKIFSKERPLGLYSDPTENFSVPKIFLFTLKKPPAVLAREAIPAHASAPAQTLAFDNIVFKTVGREGCIPPSGRDLNSSNEVQRGPKAPFAFQRFCVMGCGANFTPCLSIS